MLHYLVQWGQLYIIHFGIWMTLLCFMDAHKDGLPSTKELPSKLKAALILSAILSAFSSHSHHFITAILPKI